MDYSRVVDTYCYHKYGPIIDTVIQGHGTTETFKNKRAQIDLLDVLSNDK